MWCSRVSDSYSILVVSLSLPSGHGVVSMEAGFPTQLHSCGEQENMSHRPQENNQVSGLLWKVLFESSVAAFGPFQHAGKCLYKDHSSPDGNIPIAAVG